MTIEGGDARERLRLTLARKLIDLMALFCTRDQSAWGEGTMGADDFELVAYDEGALDDLADAILAAFPVLSRAAAPEPDIEALRAARAETWDEAIAAVFAWWAAAPEDRPAVVVNPYGVGLPVGGDDE